MQTNEYRVVVRRENPSTEFQADSRITSRPEHPAHEEDGRHECCDSKSSFAIAPAEFYISQRQQRAADYYGYENCQQQDDQHPLAITHYRNLCVAWLVPRVKNFEVNRFAFKRTGFDVDFQIGRIGI